MVSTATRSNRGRTDPRPPHRLGYATTALIIGAALLAMAPGPAFSAENWAARLVRGPTTHDFGTVARGADVEHRFVLKNIYVGDVRIKSVRSSCGCTKPSIEKSVLHTYDEGAILAKVDTKQFTGRRGATLTVRCEIDTPSGPIQNEVQFQVHVYIRKDVVLQPGAVSFGTVQPGSSTTQHVRLEYAGRSDWQIVSIEQTSPYIEINASETHREPIPGRSAYRVGYDIQVSLTDDVPEGYVHDQVQLVTNDPNPRAAHVVLPIDGLVMPTISARPQPLLLGNVAPGEEVTKNLVLRGAEPFRVLSIRSDDPRLRFARTTTRRSIHIIPVTFEADQQVGQFVTHIHIRTDLSDEDELQVEVEGRVTELEKEPGEAAPRPTTSQASGRIPRPESKPSRLADASLETGSPRVRSSLPGMQEDEGTPLRALGPRRSIAENPAQKGRPPLRIQMEIGQ